jgi:hypothetical protein
MSPKTGQKAGETEDPGPKRPEKHGNRRTSALKTDVSSKIAVLCLLLLLLCRFIQTFTKIERVKA